MLEVVMYDSEQIFGPGERVEVWDAAAGKWKAATVKAVYFDPGEQLPNGEYVPPEERYEVICGGRDDPRLYRAEELRPVK
jgi:hypothetical protein